MKSGCKFCDNCYGCALNWDCAHTLEDQADWECREGEYEYDQEIYTAWDFGEFYKD